MFPVVYLTVGHLTLDSSIGTAFCFIDTVTRPPIELALLV